MNAIFLLEVILRLQLKTHRQLVIFFLTTLFFVASVRVSGQVNPAGMRYTVSMPERNRHIIHVQLSCKGWSEDAPVFKMPKWMPGYYQIMDYAKQVKNFSALDNSGRSLPTIRINDNTWKVEVKKGRSFSLAYDIIAERKFVANPYVDSTHAYLVPAGLFLYPEGHINTPVAIKINTGENWKDIATGLEKVSDRGNVFTAPDFDILYDSPLLVGNLEELPAFVVKGVKHRFIGFQMGEFDRHRFMDDLKKMVEAAVNIIGDIPFSQYTFIAIGPGQGGIEHLNNTTVSFDGKGLNSERGRQRMLSFLAHEYFHHYNVKRIRPFELGPFDYDRENKTNLLWVSEGLSVYYEHIILKRAGITDESTLLNIFSSQITAVENNPGRHFQSLTQASFETWSDGPFGKQGKEAEKSISYYAKGPVVGLLLDFAIRQASENKKSLDDVFRYLYRNYYKEKKRGFTDAEFQEACERIAGKSLMTIFEYVYTTKDLDYKTFLGYAGLVINDETDPNSGKRKVSVRRDENITPAQSSMLEQWLGVEFDGHKWNAPYSFAVPAGWTVERFIVPPFFAPEVAYQGVEDIRFTPGWADAKSDDYWSYAFLWWIDEVQDINVASIEKKLIAYYNGLITVANGVPRDKALPVKVELKKTADANTYEGAIDMLDYMSKKPLTLHCILHVKSCKDGGKTVMFFQLSPKQPGHKVWQTLNELWTSFSCTTN